MTHSIKTTARHFFCAGIASLALAVTVQAAVIVDLPSTGFTSSGHFVGSPTTGPTVFTTLGGMTGSNANLISPSSTATATSEVFYGAIEGSFNLANAWHPTVNLNTANMIEIRSRAENIPGTGFPGGTTPAAGGFAGFIMWKSDDFLAPAYTFDSTSRISLTVNIMSNVNTRYLINIGSSYYVSSNLITTSAGDKNSGDLTALTWLNYDPTTDLFFSSGSTASIVSDGLIENITGVGLYVAGAGAANALRFNNLEVTAIPEPSTLMLLGGGLLALFVLKRRTKRV